jgi:hypothetical protein
MRKASGSAGIPHTLEQAALSSLQRAYQDFTARILPLTDEQFLSAVDSWSPRDVVAHLIGWNGLMIEASRSILGGNAPAYYADAANDYSHINAGFTAKYSCPSKVALLSELQASMKSFEAFILALPAGELAADHGVRHYSGVPASVYKIIQSLAGDYDYHTRQISEWIDRDA